MAQDFAFADAPVSGGMVGTICRVAGQQSGVGDVSVRLNRITNERTLFFASGVNDTGGETSITCEGPQSEAELSTCLSQEGHVVGSVADCPLCPCSRPVAAFPRRFAYMTEMAGSVERACTRPWEWAGDTYNVLIVGMGGGAMATHIAQACPHGVHVDGVEYDGRVVNVSERYFGVAPSDFMEVEQADATTAVGRRATEGRTYDAVLIDCFSQGGETPESCRSDGFLASLRKVVGHGGFVAHHLWHKDPEHPQVAPEFNATVGLYQTHFAATRVAPLPTRVNDVVYAAPSGDSLPTGTL